ncbi:glycosyltransferase family 4 protein [Mesonia ostreae]|uniref:Glycosyltransferase family 4 protein n=1 Tax=Mesonia ostreae TaxID=861110 RepID=A0ABU2KH77_9FLAO|nr:glycosyltransferase family 4 protein [Mesonia ostreae]MDT0294044.1 glycosyltransferase family 4 protein [Mesonia ostreae]
MKTLIVGNGSIGVSNENNTAYITKNTGKFLKRLKTKFDIHFLDFQSKYDNNNNILNFDLNSNEISHAVFGNKRNPLSYFKLIYLISRVDYIYLFYPATLSRMVGMMAVILNKPFGLYIRGQYYNQNKTDRYILKRTKFILTISPSFAQDMYKFCRRVEVIKPMIDIDLRDFKRNRAYSLPEKWNLLFVGRVEERKGIYELIEIAEDLKANSIDFTLNIVGGGDLFVEVNKKIINSNLQEEIIVHGLISDKNQLKELYDKAHAFVFTSHDEGFPRVLYEAMASGLPIFTTFVGGISGRMKHLENCIEIPVKNANGAGAIISDYLTDEKMLEEIGRNGQKTLEKIIDGSLLTHEDLLVRNINTAEDMKL